MQMAPRQIPQPKTQPSEPVYGVEELRLFPRHTRATFKETFGEEAPPYNPARRIQRWFDSTAMEVNRRDAADEPITYVVHDHGEASGVRSITMTRAEAAAPNLPGVMVYPKYQPAPSKAWINGPDTSAPFPVQYLCERDQANEIAREVGATTESVRQLLPGGPYSVLWAGETRRPWAFDLNGDVFYAETLRLMKFAAGVGAPGKWEHTASGPVWVPAFVDSGQHDLRPEIPIPIRPLQWNEKLERGLGGVWRVRRIDLLSDHATKESRDARALYLLEQIALRLEIRD